MEGTEFGTNLVIPPKHTSVPGKFPTIEVTRANVYVYPDGGELVGYRERVHLAPFLVDIKHGRRAGKTPEEYEKEHCRRAACMLRRRARNAGLVKMWTLTFPGQGIHDYDVAAQLFSRWMNDYGNVFFRGYYVAVPELHPGGHGWHWHILTRKYISVEKVRRSWTNFLIRRGYEPTGGAKYVRIHVKRMGSSRRAASYIAKYVSKSIGVGIPKGRKRYRYGENTALPVPAQRLTFLCDVYRASVVAVMKLKLEGVRKCDLWMWDPSRDSWPCFIVSW